MKRKKRVSVEKPVRGVPKAATKAPAENVPTEAEAAVAIARAWLVKAGFHEDPSGESPERVKIGFSDVGANGERYVNVRVYVPALDIDHVVDGTHPDGITTEAP